MSAHKYPVSRRRRGAMSVLLSVSLLFGGIAPTAAQDSLSFKPVTPDVILDKYKMGDSFRYSVCTGQFLRAGDPSPICNKSNAKSVSGGHNAPYVFSTGTTFLPPGVHIDANGVLSGVVTADILNKPMIICVRQLNEQANCKGLGKFTGIQSIAATASTTASTAPSTAPAAGPSTAGAIGGTLLVGGLVAGGVALAAAAAGSTGGGSGGPSTVQCSQRTCIASGFSCSCSNDSTNTSCSTQFPVAGSGTACIAINTNNRIAWCAPGLSCINGSCGTRQGC